MTMIVMKMVLSVKLVTSIHHMSLSHVADFAIDLNFPEALPVQLGCSRWGLQLGVVNLRPMFRISRRAGEDVLDPHE